MKSKINVRLLRRIAKHIAAEPRRFQMGEWIYRKEEFPAKLFPEYSHRNEPTMHRFAPCGTAACIGGWAEILAGVGKPGKPLSSHQAIGGDTPALFNVDNWPSQFAQPYLDAATPAKRVRIAVKRIEHFIATEGTE